MQCDYFAVHLTTRVRHLKTNLPANGRGRKYEFAYGVDELLNSAVMVLKAVLKFDQFGHNLLIGGERFAHADEGAYHEDAHLDRTFGIENGGGHDCAVLGEGIG